MPTPGEKKQTANTDEYTTLKMNLNFGKKMYLFWFILWVVVVVSEPAIAAFAPGVQGPIVKDTGTMGGAT